MKDIKHELSQPLYNLYFSEEPDFEHSKRGAVWKVHKYIRKVNGRYIYPKDKNGSSRTNNTSGNAHRYKWDNKYTQEAIKYNAEKAGDVRVWKRQDGTVIVSYPGHNIWTLPPGSNTSSLINRLKNMSSSNYKDSNQYINALTNAINGMETVGQAANKILTNAFDDIAKTLSNGNVTLSEIQDAINTARSINKSAVSIGNKIKNKAIRESVSNIAKAVSEGKATWDDVVDKVNKLEKLPNQAEKQVKKAAYTGLKTVAEEKNKIDRVAEKLENQVKKQVKKAAYTGLKTASKQKKVATALANEAKKEITNEIKKDVVKGLKDTYDTAETIKNLPNEIVSDMYDEGKKKFKKFAKWISGK